ncbi:hypothetical protein DP113_34625 (plasmid) [Brasilonema octagenarum UFV-E1]|uniref:Uncharacterized protein n=2 Tax=Brasilonema TaxID=383614 RepID=A0A856MR78_9CYAN|nr:MULTISPECIES: hypothetical protein [Brasilonema]KAB8333836.1 hypothetical protein SD80_011270 [Scytonema tolypothrichoides VB-61278]NMF63275.1 hypothetical protein [Brasilonema octagenarum UFV-OR1]QDL12844.1 hypothetical protein DP114_34520 [Brasilonema sennae CENA114]QDL19240.1 hypothetical protein DP113_34625 [Brasilonema octagenarum UFV-E1]
MDNQKINYLLEGICTFHWNADFKKFCEVCNFDPNHAYSHEKWQHWQQLVSSIKAFDQNILAKLIEAGHR